LKPGDGEPAPDYRPGGAAACNDVEAAISLDLDGCATFRCGDFTAADVRDWLAARNRVLDWLDTAPGR
jgi:hypothetical protein